jgi:hypothetical protein
LFGFDQLEHLGNIAETAPSLRVLRAALVFASTASTLYQCPNRRLAVLHQVTLYGTDAVLKAEANETLRGIRLVKRNGTHLRKSNLGGFIEVDHWAAGAHANSPLRTQRGFIIARHPMCVDGLGGDGLGCGAAT